MNYIKLLLMVPILFISTNAQRDKVFQRAFQGIAERVAPSVAAVFAPDSKKTRIRFVF